MLHGKYVTHQVLTDMHRLPEEESTEGGYQIVFPCSWVKTSSNKVGEECLINYHENRDGKRDNEVKRALVENIGVGDNYETQ